jgi:fucose permease
MTTTSLPAPRNTSTLRHLAPLLISFMVAIAYALPMGILGVAWSQISTDLNQPYDRLGVLLTAALIGRVSMTLFGGQILVRFGVFRCIVIGLAGMTLGFFAYFTASSWEALLFAALIAALGNGVMDIGLTLVVVSRYRAGTLNWMHATFGVGLIIGPLLLTYVNAMGWGWRAAYLVPMIVVAITLVAALFTRHEWELPVTRDVNGAETKRGAAVRDTLRQPVVWLWVVVAFVYGGIEVSVQQLSKDMLVSERGLAVETAAYWMSLAGLAFTVGRMLTSFLMRYPPHLLLRGYAIGTVVGASVLLIPNPTAALIGLLIISAAMAGFFPTQLAMLPARVGTAHAPNALGFTISAVSIGLTAMPGLGAWLAAQGGFGVIPPFFLSITVVLVVLVVLVRPTPAQNS